MDDRARGIAPPPGRSGGFLTRLLAGAGLLVEQSAALRRSRDELEARVAERTQALQQSEAAIRELLAITSDPAATFDQCVQALLHLGCRRFGQAIGVATEVAGEQLRFTHVWAPGADLKAGGAFPLCRTYCERALRQDEPLSFAHAGASEDWKAHPGYAALGLESYLGVRLKTQRGVHGTICFMDPAPRPGGFSEADADFIRLMARWMGLALDRRQDEAALRTSQEQYKQLVDLSLDIIYVTDRMGRFTFVSPAATQLAHYAEGELIGLRFTAIVRPDYRKRVEAFYTHQVLRRVASTYLEFPCLRKDGSDFWVSQRVQVLLDSDQVIGCHAVVRDVTARKRAEDTLQERARLSSFAAEVGLTLNREMSTDEMLHHCVDAAVRRLGAALARIWLVEPGDLCKACHKAAWCADRAQCLHLRASAGLSSNLNGEYRRVPLGALKIGRIAQGMGVMVTNDVLGDERLPNKDWLRENGLQSFAGFPLISEDKVFGVLAVFARVPLSGATIQTLESVCIGIAATVARKQAEEALHESEEWFRSLVGNIPGAIYRCAADEHWTMAYLSDAVENMMGYPAADFLDNRVRSYASVIHPDDRRLVEDVVHAGLAKKEPYQLEYRVLHRDGSIRWVYEKGRGVFSHDGSLRYLDGAIFDITDRKQAEEALAASERRLRSILETEPECVKVTTQDGILLDMNAAGLAMIEADSLDQVRGHCVLPLIAPEFRETYEGFLRRIHRGESGTMQFEIIGLKGARRWMDAHAVPLRNDRDGTVDILSIARDITARKKAEEALRESGERLRALYDDNPSMYFTVAPDGTVLSVNRFGAQQLGYRPDELIGASVATVVYEDDKDAVRRALAGAFSNPNQLASLEFRKVTRDGKVIWVRELVRILPAAAAAAAGTGPVALIVCDDITARKQAEEALRENERRSRSILDGALDAVIGMDARGTITDWNPRAQALFGWPRSEAIGRSLAETIIPPQYREQHTRGLKHFLTTGEGPVLNRRIEITALRRDGTEFPVELTVSAIKEGASHRFTAFLADITDRTQAEASLRRSEQARERLARNLHDDIVQSVYAAGFLLEQCRRLVKTAPVKAGRTLARAIGELNRIIKNVRGYLADPAEEPETLSADEMLRSLEHLQEIMGHGDGLRFALRLDPDAAGALTGVQRAQCLQVAHEAMSNSLRHARATKGDVFLARASDGIQLRIADNGAGFAPEQLQNGTGGLGNIRARARRLNASLDIDAAPGRGTAIRLLIPEGREASS